jgi:hypothetical protein
MGRGQSTRAENGCSADHRRRDSHAPRHRGVDELLEGDFPSKTESSWELLGLDGVQRRMVFKNTGVFLGRGCEGAGRFVCVCPAGARARGHGIGLCCAVFDCSVQSHACALHPGRRIEELELDVSSRRTRRVADVVLVVAPPLRRPRLAGCTWRVVVVDRDHAMTGRR